MNNVFIDEVLNSAVDRGDVPGVVAIVVNRDGVLYEGVFGRARVAKNVPMDVDSIFRIASMTKAITSVAALQLVDRGLLSLDGPASDVLPELADLKVLDDSGKLRSAVGDVTLRQLLTHTSGFSYPFTSPALTGYLKANGLATPGSLSLDTPLLFEPGERWQYGVSRAIRGGPDGLCVERSRSGFNLAAANRKLCRERRQLRECAG